MIPVDLKTKPIENIKEIKDKFQGLKNAQKIGQIIVQPFPQKLDHLKNRKVSLKNQTSNQQRQSNSQYGSDRIIQRQTIPNAQRKESSFDHRQKEKIKAHQNRQRKKKYIKLMQTQIQQMEREISRTNSEIQKYKFQIYNFQIYQEGKKKQFKTRQAYITKKLEGLLNNIDLQDRDNEIDICLDSLVYRVGATGSERKAAVDRIYNNIINLGQPALFKYILWSAYKKKHLFKNSLSKQDQKWGEEIQKIADTFTLEKKESLEPIREGLSQKMVKTVESSKRLDSVKRKLQKLGQYLDDNIIGILREILNPEQVALLVRFSTRHQYKPEFLLCENEEVKEQQEPHLQKKIKTEKDGDCPILRVT